MILPAIKDINKAKAAERKIEIDNGVSLARQIDSLRATFAQERVAHDVWKKSSIEELDRQLQGYQDGIDAKKREIAELDEQRRKLIEPLDGEWEGINVAKVGLSEERKNLFLDTERFKEEAKELEREVLKVAKTLARAEENEVTSKKRLDEAEEYKAQAKKLYQEAVVSKEQHDTSYESRTRELEASIQEYQVALATISLREQEVKDKELELSEREVLLKDRQAMFERNLKRT